MARRKKGLLALLFGGGSKNKTRKAQSKQKQQSKPKLPDIQTVQLPDAEPLRLPRGERSLIVYVYDGRPLKGTRKDSNFELAVVPGVRSTKSIYTGTVWESDIAVAYNGMIIGHLESTATSYVTRLMREYPYITVQASRLGTDEGGWPIVMAYLPMP